MSANILIFVRQIRDVQETGLLDAHGHHRQGKRTRLITANQHVFHEWDIRVDALQQLRIHELAVLEFKLAAQTASEREEPLAVHAEQIACAIPHLARVVGHQSLGRLLGIVQITQHHVPARGPQLAHPCLVTSVGPRLRVPVRDLAAIFSHDLDFYQGPAHSAHTPTTLIVCGNKGCTLRGAVALKCRDVQHILEEVEGVRIGLGRTHDHELQPVAYPRGELRLDLSHHLPAYGQVDQLVQDRCLPSRDALLRLYRPGDQTSTCAALLDLLPHIAVHLVQHEGDREKRMGLRVPQIHQHSVRRTGQVQRPPLGKGEVDVEDPQRVVVRRRFEQHGLRPVPDLVTHRLHVRHDILMGLQDRLGQSRRTRGKNHLGLIARTNLAIRQRGIFPGLHHVKERLVARVTAFGENHFRRACQAGGHTRHLLPASLVDKEELRFGEIDVVNQNVVRQLVAQRHRGRTNRVAGQKHQ